MTTTGIFDSYRFGISIPDSIACWGARAIQDSHAGLDILPDRRFFDADGAANKADRTRLSNELWAWVQGSHHPATLVITPRDLATGLVGNGTDPLVPWKLACSFARHVSGTSTQRLVIASTDGVFRFELTPNGSCGYIYLGAAILATPAPPSEPNAALLASMLREEATQRQAERFHFIARKVPGSAGRTRTEYLVDPGLWSSRRWAARTFTNRQHAIRFAAEHQIPVGDPPPKGLPGTYPDC